MIKLEHNIHDNYIIKFKNEGNQYIVGTKERNIVTSLLNLKLKKMMN